MAGGAALGLASGLLSMVTVSLVDSSPGSCVSVIGGCIPPGAVEPLILSAIVSVLGAVFGFTAVGLSYGRWREADPREGTDDVWWGVAGGFLLIASIFVSFLGSGGALVAGSALGALLLLLGSIWLKNSASASVGTGDDGGAPAYEGGYSGWSPAQPQEVMADRAPSLARPEPGPPMAPGGFVGPAGRFCPFCGTTNDPRYNFCGNCRQALP